LVKPLDNVKSEVLRSLKGQIFPFLVPSMAWDNRDGKSQDQHWYLLGRAASALLGTRETVWPPSSQLAGQICKPPSSPFASRRFFQNPSGQNRSSELFLAFSQIVFYRVLNQAKEMSQGDFSEAAIKRIHHI